MIKIVVLLTLLLIPVPAIAQEFPLVQDLAEPKGDRPQYQEVEGDRITTADNIRSISREKLNFTLRAGGLSKENLDYVEIRLELGRDRIEFYPQATELPSRP